MMCDGCKRKPYHKATKCLQPATCTCQHRRPVVPPSLPDRVAESIALRKFGALELNADIPPVDC